MLDYVQAVAKLNHSRNRKIAMSFKIKVLTIDEKRMTRSLFNQLPRWYPRNLTYRDRDVFLGRVVLPRKDDILQIVWTDQNKIYVAEIPHYQEGKLNEDYLLLKGTEQLFV